jgi:hypothetical protein
MRNLSPSGRSNQAERRQFTDQVLRMGRRLSLLLRQQYLGEKVMDLLFRLRATQEQVDHCTGSSVEEMSLPRERIEDNRFVVEVDNSKTVARDETARICEAMASNPRSHRAAARDV